VGFLLKGSNWYETDFTRQQEKERRPRRQRSSQRQQTHARLRQRGRRRLTHAGGDRLILT